MTPELRARTERRAEATRRRSELTAAAAVIGLVATAGFGWLAAETYAGTPSKDGTSTTVAPPAGSGETERDNAGSPSVEGAGSATSGSASDRSTRSRSGSSIGGSSSNQVTRGSSRAHVSTGSS
jgi:hypothetical protein